MPSGERGRLIRLIRAALCDPEKCQVTGTYPKIESATAVDSHVHLHDAFDLPRFFDAAARNFENACRASRAPRCGTPIMLLTETARADYFGRLAATLAGSPASLDLGDWRPARTDEECSLLLESGDGKQLAVVAGRQVVTREKLEVLMLGTLERVPDGRPIEDVIKISNAANAITVIPWGFGKWLGKRGEIVRRLIRERQDLEFHLGDNSGRLQHAPAPSEFKLGIDRGCRLLPGSDPLPFSSEQSQAGRFGFLVEGLISPDRPADSLRQRLEDPGTTLIPYGRGERLFRFLRNQVRMQMITRIAPPRSAESGAVR